MWDFIKAVSTSVYIIPVLVFTLIVLLIVILLVKKGLISVNTKAVRVGTSESERAIIRQQIEWVHLHCDSLEKSLPTRRTMIYGVASIYLSVCMMRLLTG